MLYNLYEYDIDRFKVPFTSFHAKICCIQYFLARHSCIGFNVQHILLNGIVFLRSLVWNVVRVDEAISYAINIAQQTIQLLFGFKRTHALCHRVRKWPCWLFCVGERFKIGVLVIGACWLKEKKDRHAVAVGQLIRGKRHNGGVVVPLDCFQPGGFDIIVNKILVRKKTVTG